MPIISSFSRFPRLAAAADCGTVGTTVRVVSRCDPVVFGAARAVFFGDVVVGVCLVLGDERLVRGRDLGCYRVELVLGDQSLLVADGLANTVERHLN